MPARSRLLGRPKATAKYRRDVPSWYFRKYRKVFALASTIIAFRICTPPDSQGSAAESKTILSPPLPRERMTLHVLPVRSDSIWASRSVWCQFTGMLVGLFEAKMFEGRRQYVGKTDKFVLLIEDRLTLASWWSIPWTLNMLGPEWGMQIIASPDNRYVFDAIVAEYRLTNVYVETLVDKYGLNASLPPKWVHDVHFMLTKQFWMELRGEHIIIMQDHGVPVRRWDTDSARSILRNIFKYAYAGAPWSLNEQVTTTKAVTGTNLTAIRQSTDWKIHAPGGNGGFSYRKKSWMVAFGVDSGTAPEDLLRTDISSLLYMGHENEDWIWGQILGQKRHGVAPKHLERLFSAETLQASTGVLGVHNYATYNDVWNTIKLVQSAAKEFYHVSKKVFDVRVLARGEAADSPWLHSWRKIKERYPNLFLPMECTVPEGEWVSPWLIRARRVYSSVFF